MRKQQGVSREELNATHWEGRHKNRKINNYVCSTKGDKINGQSGMGKNLMNIAIKGKYNFRPGRIML